MQKQWVFQYVSSHRRKCKPPKRSKEEDNESENIYLLKNKRKSYIVGITKLINYIIKLIDRKGSFSDFSKFDKSLESHIQNIWDLTTKIIGSESDDIVVQLELQICTEQEFRVIQIRNAVSSYFENKDVFPINLNKETKPPSLDVVSQNNSLPKIKTPSQIEKEVLLTSQTLNTKIKTKSRHHSISSKYSSKSSLKSSSSSRHTYLSFNSRET